MDDDAAIFGRQGRVGPSRSVRVVFTRVSRGVPCHPSVLIASESFVQTYRTHLPSGKNRLRHPKTLSGRRCRTRKTRDASGLNCCYITTLTSSVFKRSQLQQKILHSAKILHKSTHTHKLDEKMTLLGAGPTFSLGSPTGGTNDPSMGKSLGMCGKCCFYR